MNKQLIIFLVVLVAIVGGLASYHKATPNHFDGEAFFGPK